MCMLRGALAQTRTHERPCGCPKYFLHAHKCPQMPLPPLSRLTLDTTTHHAPGPPLESLLREGGRRARRRRAHQLVGLDCRRGRGPRGLHAVPRNVLLVELHLLVREQAPVHHLLDRVLVHVHADKHDLLAAVPGRHVVVVPGREGVSVQ